MNTHPSASYNPPGPTTTDPFAPEAIYELKIDTDGDLAADIAYRVRFSATGTGTPTATLRRVEGAAAGGSGGGGELIVAGAPVSLGQEARVTEAGAYRFFAGWRSDPFFFDVRGALNDLQFTGDDFFADKDVCSIALEVPNAALGPGAGLGLWHRTLVAEDGGGWVQADRGARPAQAVFLPGEERAAYLAGEPAHDARFVAGFAHALAHAGGYTPQEAQRAAGTLLHAPRRLPNQRPNAHRRRAGRLPGGLHQREGDGRPGGPPHRPPARVSLPGPAPPRVTIIPRVRVLARCALPVPL